jgi:hypothetical protein
LQAWKDNGLPPNIPFFMTEGNDLGDGSPHTVKSGLWLADYVGAMMTAGAGGTYYFHYIASPGRGGHAFLTVDDQNHASFSAQYLATQVITQEWVQPVDKTHKLFKAVSNVLDGNGNEIITAYPVERPDGQWSIMLINKDENHDHSVRVAFDDPVTRQTRSFTGTVDRIVFGAGEYQWHPDPPTVADTARPSAQGTSDGQVADAADAFGRTRDNGYRDPDGPATRSTVTAAGPDTLYELPKASIIVLRGTLRSQ